MHGMRVTGWPVGTIVRGRRVMWEGELLPAAKAGPCASWRRSVTKPDEGATLP